MAASRNVVVSAAVEGDVDGAVLRKLLESAGGILHGVHGRKGKHNLKNRVEDYNQAARLGPWILLVDLDDDFECAPALLHEWLPRPAPGMCFRVAVREIESWLLADAEQVANFMAVKRALVPADPEGLDSPKRRVVDLARQSRRREIREDIVPRPESGRVIGPAYNSRLIEFVTQQWRPRVAERRSPSLRGCRAAIARLIRG